MFSPHGGGGAVRGADADEKPDGGFSKEDIQSLAGIASALGLVPILIVIIGRLWTTTYFDHIGLPSSGLEFDVYDYAFRSREVLISLVLGVIGFSAAWLYRDWLRERGPWFALFEVGAVLALIAGAFVGVEALLSPGTLVSTGVLGLSSGLPLAAMAWFAVDIWQGPGDLTRWGSRLEFVLDRLTDVLSLIGWGASQKDAALVLWRIAAIAVFLGIGFGYLPQVSERLAHIEAAADVGTGRFAGAFLESEGSLPPEIASSADPTKSKAVRVILSQSQNTYVLHSTTCTAVGDFGPVPASVADSALTEAADSTLAEILEPCEVFTIPTVRLKSIRYFQLGTKEPASESVVRPVEVGLGDEPSQELFSSEDASDDQQIECRGVSFFKSVWYEFIPPTDGSVLVRVQADGFTPIVGVWEAPEEETAVLDNISGSGEDPQIACETRAANAGQEDTQLVGVVANVRSGARYVASAGAQQDTGGPGSVTFEFFPEGSFLRPAILEEELPEVELPSTPGKAQLELRELDRTAYALRALTGLREGTPTGFSVVSKEDITVRLELVEVQDDRTLLESKRALDPGTWRLRVPGGFVGQVRLTVTVQPDLVIALAEGSAGQLDVRIQQALLAAIDEMEIRDRLGFEGRVVFDRGSLAPAALSFEPGETDTTSPGELLEEAGVAEGLTVQIQVEEGREEERATLLAAAAIVQQQLLVIRLDATIAPCEDVCLRIFFASE